MKSHASMNRIYRLVWNAALSLWVAVAENAKGRSKGGSVRGSVLFDPALADAAEGGGGGGSGFRLNSACRAALVLLASLVVLTHEAHAADAANAAVSAGSGSVSTLGNTTTIHQSSQRLAIDWTSLSTAANEALRFNQPNAAAIALNRITGSSPSELLGSLTANGQVFILNPNGVLFGAGSQVNVGGLVASTLSMSNADFMAGNHVFTGSGGSGSVVNQGTLTAANGGYIALLAPEVRNEGVIGATLGTALLAAGNKVTLTIDNGSLLGYSIDQGAINALAENRQLIKADGGQVLLGAKALDSVTTAAVNNTGIIEAKTFQNKAGRILLIGDMETGTVNVGGTLDASAPNGGDGGFIETSAAHVKVASGTRVSTSAPNGHTGKWLIDPNDFTIAASGGDMDAATVSANLATTNFEIQTAAMGTAGGNGDIFVNEDVSWSSANTLTLTAERNIALNNAITANTGGLSLNAAGNISAPAAVNVGTFTLVNGYWSQTGALPGFSATDFRINGGTFVRALGGDGSAGNAYQLSDVYGLQGAGSAGMLGKSYVLASNVDASGTAAWNASAGFKPIGTDPGNFTGSFDGQGHAISNLIINRPTEDYVGLFGVTGSTGTVANVGLVGGSVSGNNYVGALVGINHSGSISNSYATGTVTGNLITGALVGINNSGSISNSYANAAVTGSNYTGGLVGYNNFGSISNSYATGTVTGSNNTGGLVGYNDGGSSISSSYATGAATGINNTGGLVGNNDGVVTSSFWNTETSGRATSAGGTGKTTAEMQQSSTFTNAGWNASNVGGDGTIWRIYEGQTGPLLRSFLTAATVLPAYDGSDAVLGNASSSTVLVNNTNAIANAALVLGSSNATALNISSNGSAGSYSASLNSTGPSGGYYSGQQGYDLVVASRTIATPGSAVGDIKLASDVNWTNGTLNINAVGTIDLNSKNLSSGAAGTANFNAGAGITNAGSVNVGTFDLQTGTWNQVAGSLPTFSATDFRISGGTFVRALGGDGSAGNAYQLSDVYGLQGAGSAGMLDKNYVLANNVDANGTAGWNAGAGFKPIGYNSDPFSGSFDGQSHTISNLTINRPAEDWVGLFGTLGASRTVANVGLTGASVAGSSHVGGLVGRNNGWISNSYATGVVTGGPDSSGGLVGENLGSISNSYAAGVVTGDYGVGGLAGTNYGNITNSYATGAVAAIGFNGGLVGWNAGGSITNSYATGAVTGSYSFGGLVGVNQAGIADSFWNTDTSGQSTSAGGTGKTTAEMMQASTFTGAGWSASNVGGDGTTWRIYEGQTGPLLRGFLAALNLVNTSVTYNGGTQAGAATAVAGVSGSAASARNAGSYNTGYYSNQQGYDIIGGGLDIAKADLTLSTSNVTKTYDGTLSAAGTAVAAAGTSLLGGDTGSGGSFSFTDKNSGTGNKTVTTTGVTVNDGNGGNNYNVSYVDNTTSTINKASLTVTATGVTKTYDGTTSATGTGTVAALAGAAAGEVVDAVGSQAFLDKNAGTGNKAVRASGVTIKDSGNADVTGNYNIAYVDDTTSTINKANLTLSTSDVTKPYDGTTGAAGTVVVTAGTVFSGDNTTGGSFAFTDKNAGTGNKTVTTSGVTVGDGVNNANYDVTYADNSTSTINKANLTVTATSVTKTYDGTISATGTGSVGALAGAAAGEVVNTAATQAFTDKNAGSGNKTVQASGLTIKDSGNADVTGNYNIAYVDNTSSTINKADLTVTANAVTKTYDGTTAATGTGTVAALAGAAAGEVVDAAGSQAFLDKNFGIGNKAVRASGVTIKDSGNVDVTGNYNIAYVDNTAGTINKADLTLSTSDVTKTYDGTLSANGTVVVTSGTIFAGDSATGGTFAFTNRNVGNGIRTVTTSGVTVGDGVNNSNYNVSYAENMSSTINQANLVLTTSDVTKTYDGTTSAAGTAQATGGTALLGGDLVSGGTFAFTDKNAGSGNKTVTAAGVTVHDGNSGNNYNISYVDNTTSTINKANLTVTATGVTKTYDGTTSATGTGSAGTLAGAGAGEVVDTAATQVFTDKNFGIGNKTVQASGLTIKDSGNVDVTGNYNIAYVDNTTSTINKADLTVTATGVTKTYDGTTSATGTGTVATLAGAGAGELVDSFGSQAFLNKNAGTGNKAVRASGVTIKDSGNADVTGNYNIAYVDDTTSTINQASLVLTTNSVTKTYDGTLGAAGTAAVSSGTVFSGDSLSGGSFAFTDKNVGNGNKTVQTSGVTVGDGVNNGNYVVTYADNTTSTINQASLTVTATGVTKTYDGTTSATGTGSVGTLAGVGAGESVNTAATQAFTDKNAGSGNKTVQASGLTIKDSGNVDVTGNYNITYVDNTTSTINKADLTVTATGVTKTYDGTTAATGTGTVAALAGAAAGEVVDAAGSQAFLDKNFGIGNKAVRASGVTIKDSGNVDVTGNYNIAYVDNTASTINKADVTLSTSDVTKTYDGTLGAAGAVVVTAGTVFAGDNTTGGSFAFTNKNAGTGNKTVTTTGVTVGDGVNNANYNVTYADNTTSTINQANLVLTSNNVTKTYDGTLGAAGTAAVSSGTVFSGDSLSGGSFAFTDKNAGTGNKTVTTAGVAVNDGNGGNNYNVSYVDNTTSTINKANLTVTATGVTKTYDGTTSATGTGSVGTLAGAAAGEVVNAAATQVFTDKNAGIGNKTVQASGLTIKDSGNADVTGNYNIAYVDNTASTINKADLTVTATSVTKTYDGTLNATGTGTVAALAGAGAGEVVNAAGSQAFLDKNAGIGNKTVRASGVSIKDAGNADVTGNYNIAYVDDTTSTINKANLTLSTSDVTKTYDGTTSATGAAVVTAGAIFTGDNATGGTFAFTDKNAGTGNKTVTTSGVTVGDGANNANYNVSYADNTTSTINRANLTVTATGVTKTYDGTTSATGTGSVGTLAGAGAGEVVNAAATQAFTDKNFGIGNKTVQASGLTIKDSGNADVTGNYNIAYVDNTTSTINKADLTVTATGVTKTYDGTLSAAGTGTVAALAGAGGGDLVNSGGSQTFLDKNAGSGNKAVRASGVTIRDAGNADMTGNYNITYVDDTTSTINKANLSLSTSDVIKTYDGGLSAAGTVVVTTGTVFAGDNTTGGSFSFTDKNTGTGNKTVTTSGVTVGDGVNNANYNVTYVDNTSSTINQANLTLTTSNVTKTYDGTTGAAGTATVAAGTLFGGDSLTGGSFVFTDKNAGTGNKTVQTSGVTVGDGVNNGNYAITYADNTTSTINPFAVSLSGTRTYDGTANVAAGVLNLGPLVGSETLGLTGTAAMADKNVGANKTLTVTGLSLTDGSGLASNYTFTGGVQQAGITQASLTVGSSNVTKTYDGNLSAAGAAMVTAGTLFSGDSLTGGTFAFTDKNAGTGNKTVTTSGVTVGDGVNNGNYAVTYANNTTSTINKADLTVTATGVNKVYDGTTAATVAYGDNRVAGDVVGITGSASFADRNAGTGKAVGVNGIALGGTDAGNYNLLNSTTTTTASISPKALTVTANGDTKLYDGSAYGGGNGVSYNGFVAGDSSADIGGALAYGGSSQGAVAAGNYLITPGGLSSISGNYALGFVDGALSITTSNASTAAVGNAGLVSSYDAALQAVAGLGGSSGGGGGGGFGGGAAAADALAAAAAEAGKTGEE
ncbi:YDG domain-containing protein [Polaromonas sp. LjRoot131]|uniref:YDG domain-containing protein n=1 Tax=Polaromonas sp. LjRoot131 TaxID=3342262 RepID=UPI003ED0DFD9